MAPKTDVGIPNGKRTAYATARPCLVLGSMVAFAVAFSPLLFGCGNKAEEPLRDQPDHVRAQNLLNAGLFDEASAFLRRQLEDQPDDARLNRLLGEAHLQGGRFSKASEYLGRAVRLDGGQALRAGAAALSVGKDRILHGDATSAASAFDISVRFAPQSRLDIVKTCAPLAISSMRSGDLGQARTIVAILKSHLPANPTELVGDVVSTALETGKAALAARVPNNATLALGIALALGHSASDVARIYADAAKRELAEGIAHARPMIDAAIGLDDRLRGELAAASLSILGASDANPRTTTGVGERLQFAVALDSAGMKVHARSVVEWVRARDLERSSVQTTALFRPFMYILALAATCGDSLRDDAAALLKEALDALLAAETTELTVSAFLEQASEGPVRIHGNTILASIAASRWASSWPALRTGLSERLGGKKFVDALVSLGHGDPSSQNELDSAVSMVLEATSADFKDAVTRAQRLARWNPRLSGALAASLERQGSAHLAKVDDNISAGVELLSEAVRLAPTRRTTIHAVGLGALASANRALNRLTPATLTALIGLVASTGDATNLHRNREYLLAVALVDYVGERAGAGLQSLRGLIGLNPPDVPATIASQVLSPLPDLKWDLTGYGPIEVPVKDTFGPKATCLVQPVSIVKKGGVVAVAMEIRKSPRGSEFYWREKENFYLIDEAGGKYATPGTFRVVRGGIDEYGLRAEGEHSLSLEEPSGALVTFEAPAPPPGVRRVRLAMHGARDNFGTWWQPAWTQDEWMVLRASPFGPPSWAPQSSPTEPVAEPRSRDGGERSQESLADFAAALARGWAGTWRHLDFVYEAKISLALDAAGSVEGRIEWTLRKAPDGSHLMKKLGTQGVEYVRGSLRPGDRVLELEGYRKDDPENVIGLDRYRLTLSDDLTKLSGSSRAHGTWAAIFELRAR